MKSYILVFTTEDEVPELPTEDEVQEALADAGVSNDYVELTMWEVVQMSTSNSGWSLEGNKTNQTLPPPRNDLLGDR